MKLINILRALRERDSTSYPNITNIACRLKFPRQATTWDMGGFRRNLVVADLRSLSVQDIG